MLPLITALAEPMSDFEQLFLAGAHSTLVEQLWDNAAGSLVQDKLPSLIGSLCFLGRIDEAEVLFEEHGYRLEARQQAPTLFFLIIGLSRSGHSEKVRSYLRPLLALRQHGLARRFWIYQALGFLRFVDCRFQKTLNLVSKAQRSAVAANDYYARALASDLKGHAQVAIGDVFLGLKSLEQAHSYFSALGNLSHAQAIARSLITYRAKHSIDPAESLSSLENLLVELEKEENNFSLAGTYLEIARLYSLTGQLQLADQTLIKAGEIIHREGLETYSLLLNFRRAYVFYLKGEAEKALRIAQQLRPMPDDLRSQVQILGLQRAAVQSLKPSAEDPSFEARLNLLSKSAYHIGHRIELRLRSGPRQNWGRDPLGDLIDELHDVQFSREDKLERIEKLGYWSFAYEVLDLPRQRPYLVLNALPGLILLMIHGQVEAHKLQLHSQIAKLFQILAQGETAREDLVKGLWGYTYNPLRHDALVYSLMSRVRTLLGPAESYLVSHESGSYSLRNDFTVIHLAPSWQEKSFLDKLQAAEQSGSVPELSNSINQRQRKILRYLEQHEEVDLASCLGLFEGISKVTLSRDLSQLVERHVLVRTGKGRSTSYILNKSQASSIGDSHA